MVLNKEEEKNLKEYHQ